MAKAKRIFIVKIRSSLLISFCLAGFVKMLRVLYGLGTMFIGSIMADTVLSLPMGPHVTLEQIRFLVNVIKD